MVVLKKNTSIPIILKLLNSFFGRMNTWRQIARYSLLAKSMEHVGERVRFDDNVYVNYPENLTINNDVFIGKDTFLNAYDKIHIGSYTIIAAGCKLISANHRYEDLSVPINNQGLDYKSIFIDEDVWLGYGVVVLPGVHIGKGCIVAAGAVVTKNFEPYSIIAGVPARYIKNRKYQQDRVSDEIKE